MRSGTHQLGTLLDESLCQGSPILSRRSDCGVIRDPNTVIRRPGQGGGGGLFERRSIVVLFHYLILYEPVIKAAYE